MFFYGFLREFRSEYKVPYDLFGYKMAGSLLNGLFYTIPPYGALKLFYTINRIDVYHHKKDKEKYHCIYNEFLGENKQIFI